MVEGEPQQEEARPRPEDQLVLRDNQDDMEEGENRVAADFVPSMWNRFCQRFRRIISQKRHRFEFQGLDLDLAYITDRIIAVGYPSSGWEKCIRNTMNHTVEFLQRRHGTGKVKVFNLRGGFLYDPKKFDDNVIYFDMKDHHPPSLELMAPFCREAYEWLEADKENVIAVHCKAGKGRTGVMICAFLIYIQFYKNPRQILDYYSIVRTSNNKGVTIPSQRRYIYYYDFMRRKELNYFPLRQELLGVYLERPPKTRSSQSKVKVKVSNGATVVFTSKPLYINKRNYRKELASWRDSTECNTFYPGGAPFVSKRAYTFMVPENNRVFVEGDVRVDLLDDDFHLPMADRKIGHVWFNTMFVCKGMCGGDFVYGDKVWPYENEDTSIGRYKKNLPQKDILENKTYKGNWQILKPDKWDEHCPAESVHEMYTSKQMEVPRDMIIQHLYNAHEKKIVTDDHNDRTLPAGSDAYIPLGVLDPPAEVGGPFQIPHKRNQHVLTFPVYEMDRALKNKKLNNGMKLHVVLQCIDSKDATQSELAKAFCDKTHANTERLGASVANQLHEQYRPVARSADALGAEKKMPPAVRYSRDGGYEGTPSEKLTDEYYKNKKFASDPRWCRFYYRQRKESPSRWPKLKPICPLTNKMFNFDTEGDEDQDDGSNPPGSANDKPTSSTSEATSSGEGAQQSERDETTPKKSPQAKREEKSEGKEKPEGKPEGAPEGKDLKWYPAQQIIMDDLKSYKTYKTGKDDALVKNLKESIALSEEAHRNFYDVYRKHGVKDEELEGVAVPDYSEFVESMEDSDFMHRGVRREVDGFGETQFTFADSNSSSAFYDLLDHLAALFSASYDSDRNEFQRFDNEQIFKMKARRFELEYASGDRYQRGYQECVQLDNAIIAYHEREEQRLREIHKHEESKMLKLAAFFKRNRQQDVERAKSDMSQMIAERYEPLTSLTIGKWYKFSEKMDVSVM
ncbi:hypothetical protein B9Z55_016237 [Caenorhabditis nigoni]|uniref:Uncharacterized protein n=1 Tax=Caenorhabditis nigoni TaxID=1611254 RepID=A0A2G5UDT3_9PELO|nr:hypothetical protein B9Z55_016237 [Caenorhabditis nigoni]